MEKDIVVEKLFDLFVKIASLKPNKRTKSLTVNLTQEEAMSLLADVSDIASVYGKKITIDNSSGEAIVKVEEL